MINIKRALYIGHSGGNFAQHFLTFPHTQKIWEIRSEATYLALYCRSFCTSGSYR